jgi:hypothetical protein
MWRDLEIVATIISMSVQSSPIVLQADQEHEGIRYVVLVMLGVGFCLGFVLVSAVLRAVLVGSGLYDYIAVLSCVGAMPVGIGITAATEYTLKRVWPSGRTLVITGEGVTLQRRGEEDVAIEWDKRFHPLRWSFRLKGYPRGGKERRVPTSWVCLALQLHQDETKMVLFTFLPPKKADELLARYDFHGLNATDIYGNTWRERLSMPSRPEIPAKVIAGKEGRYWLAERKRWYEGLELTAGDFERLLAVVEGREARSEGHGGLSEEGNSGEL